MSSVDLELAARTVGEGMAVGIILMASDGQISYANAHACRILDTTEDELARTGRDCAVLQTLAGRGDFDEGQPGVCPRALRVVTRRGSPVYLEVSPVAFWGNASNRCTLVTLVDITSRVRLERRMEADSAISSALLRHDNLLSVLELAARHACTLFDACFASITMPYPSGRGLTLAAAHGATGSTVQPGWPSDSLLQEVLWSSTPRLIEGPGTILPEEAETDPTIGFGYVIPITSEEMTIGVLSIATPTGHPSHEEEGFAAAVDYCSALGQSIGMGLESAEKEHRADRATRQLEEALVSRVTIEQAKGMVAAIHDIGTEEAMDRIRAYARNHQRPIQSVAIDVVGRRILV